MIFVVKYKILFSIEEKEFKIEYTIKESNISYFFNVDEYIIDKSVHNIIYNKTKDNINEILNKHVYRVCKDYFLKNDIIANLSDIIEIEQKNEHHKNYLIQEILYHTKYKKIINNTLKKKN